VVDRFNDQTGFYDLWLYDVEGGGAPQFTFDPALNNFPVWSPDGRRIIWVSNREGPQNLYWKASSGAGQDELLLKSSNTNPMIPTSCSLDGRFLIYYEIDLKTKRDIWVLPLSGDRKPFNFLQTEASEAAGQLSPDGRWMAYTSDESSLFEVYVRSFPSGGGQRLVSTNGGIGPYWRRDGKELFYYAPDGKLMAVEVKSGPRGGSQEASFEAGTPRVLFEFRSGTVQPNRPYAVTADGQRFLLNTIVDESGGAPLTVVVNWQAELRR
jgi:Tol biopolymer transport system component